MSPTLQEYKLLVTGMEFLPSTVGTATYAHNLAVQMVRKGVEVVVLAPQYLTLDCAAFDQSQPYKTVRMPWTDKAYGPLRYIAARKGLSETVQQFQPDCIWTTNGAATRVLGLWKGLYELEIPVIACMCGSDIVAHLPGKGLIRRIKSIPQRRCYNYAAAINAVCSYLKSVAVSKGIEANKIFVNPSGFDVSKIEEFDFDPERVIRDNPPSAGRRVILTVARLHRQKRVDNGIRALARLLPEFPDLYYIVVGDGPEMPRLKEIAEKLDVSPQVLFKGRLNPASQELFDLYCRAQIFLLPSVHEGLANVFIEAGVFGLPCIGGNSGGTPEIIVDGHTGLLADPDDVGDIAGKMRRLLLAPEWCQILGKNAKERVYKNYSLGAIGETNYQVLKMVVDKARKDRQIV